MQITNAPNGFTRYAWRDGSPALASEPADYAPYNDRNIYADRIDRLGWLGKEKGLESGLGDHGVRKYDAGSGRFLSVDPLWEKYLSWTPYQYSMNNPVNAVDVDGREIIPQNLNQKQLNQLNSAISTIRSWNSPTANAVLDKAEGNYNKIYVNFLSGERPVSGMTKSNIGRSETLEEEWNSLKSNPSGITLKSGALDNTDADIIMDSEIIKGNMNDDGSVNIFGINPVSILDELNHAISPNRGKKKEVRDHNELFMPIINENNENIPSTNIEQMKSKTTR